MQHARPKAVVPLLPYQRVDLESDDRFRWCCWSRQVGKSFVKSLRRVVRGVLRKRDQVLVSAGERQCRELMRKVEQHCRALNLAATVRGYGDFGQPRQRRMEIGLPNGVRVLGLPANPNTIRGFTGDVLLDEFAMHPDDAAIWAAVFPTVLRQDGELDVASTPKGRANIFWRLKNNRMFGHSTVTLPQAIAAGLKVDFGAVREAIGDETLFRQEFLCEFLSEGTAFLSHETISGCQDARLSQEPDSAALDGADRHLYAGVDVGRLNDLTVIWLLERQGDVLFTRGVIEMARTPFIEQFRVLSEVLARPAVRRCCMDAGGVGMQLAEMVTEAFGEHRVESVRLTAGLKEELAGRLRVLAERQTIRIPPEERIRNDWHSIRRDVTASGHARLSAGRSEAGHGDRFWAAALAVHAAGRPSERGEFVGTGRLAFARDGIW